MDKPPTHETDYQASAEGRPFKVLVVDDDELTTKQLSAVLRLEGFEALTALNASDGLQQALDGRPDAIVLDLRMPLVDGMALLEQMRASPFLREIPVVIITGDYLLDDEVIEHLRLLGAEVRFKPFWIDDFVTMVRALLRIPPRPESPPSGDSSL